MQFFSFKIIFWKYISINTQIWFIHGNYCKISYGMNTLQFN